MRALPKPVLPKANPVEFPSPSMSPSTAVAWQRPPRELTDLAGEVEEMVQAEWPDFEWRHVTDFRYRDVPTYAAKVAYTVLARERGFSSTVVGGSIRTSHSTVLDVAQAYERRKMRPKAMELADKVILALRGRKE